LVAQGRLEKRLQPPTAYLIQQEPDDPPDPILLGDQIGHVPGTLIQRVGVAVFSEEGSMSALFSALLLNFSSACATLWMA